MSKQDIEKFRGEVEKDPTLLSTLQAQQSKSDFVKKAVELGASRGFTFTAEEVDAYIANIKPGQLSDDDLRSVAGGTQGNLQRYTYSKPGCN